MNAFKSIKGVFYVKKGKQTESRQQRITQWKASGIVSAAEWCRIHEINVDQFYYWKSRLTKKSLTPKDFVELPPTETSGIQLECNGYAFI